jgi:hypothetical protein
MSRSIGGKKVSTANSGDLIFEGEEERGGEGNQVH